MWLHSLWSRRKKVGLPIERIVRKKREMKILHYLSQYDVQLGGIVQFATSLCQELAKNANVSFAIGSGKDIPNEWLEPQNSNFPKADLLPTVPKTQQTLGRQALQKMESLIQKHAVVHLHGAWDFGNYQIAKICRSLHTPYVASPHGMLDDLPLSQKWLKKFIVKHLKTKQFFRNASVVHCTAAGEAEQVQKNISRLQRVECIPPIAKLLDDSGSITSFPALSKSLLKILFLGRIHPIKGLEHLIEACKLLHQRNLTHQLVFAGPYEREYKDQLSSQIQEAGIEEHVLWVGMIKNENEKRAIYQACDIFALPTLHENFGIVLAEAALAGLPIVTTKHTNIYRELQSAGALIAETTGLSFAEKLEQLITNSNRKSIGKQLKDFTNSWLNPKKVVTQYLDLYQSVLSVSNSKMAIERN